MMTGLTAVNYLFGSSIYSFIYDNMPLLRCLQNVIDYLMKLNLLQLYEVKETERNCPHSIVCNWCKMQLLIFSLVHLDSPTSQKLYTLSSGSRFTIRFLFYKCRLILVLFVCCHFPCCKCEALYNNTKETKVLYK